MKEGDLIPVTKENTHPANVLVLTQRYGHKAVEEATKYLTYKKTPPPLPKQEDSDTPTLYVFRHGQSHDNIDMIFSGWRTPGLTEKGRKDAEVIADLLKDKKMHLLISSDQPRTLDTMKIAMSRNEDAKDLEIIVDKRLRERNYGDWQGYSKLEKHLEDPEALSKVRRGWFTPPPNGESLEMVDERVNELLDEIIPKMKETDINVAIACSGNSIRPIRKRFEGLTEDEAAHIETPTGKDYAAYAIR
jgi:2,3-bisphosphoglycerate-dependent phosphoglycerate mutase